MLKDLFIVYRSRCDWDTQRIIARIDKCLTQLRQFSLIPFVAGFGISDREHIEQLAPYADGLVVSSAIVRKMIDRDDPAALVRILKK